MDRAAIGGDNWGIEMDQRAIGKAKSRLRNVNNAIAALEASKDYGEFSDHWYVFLTAAKNIYTTLEQGSKVSPQSLQWFGAKKRERRGDELLTYIYEARNDDEHGLDTSLRRQPERHEIGLAPEGSGEPIILNGGPFKNVVVSGYDTAVVFEGAPPPKGIEAKTLDGRAALRRSSPETAILINVNARGNRIVNPPNLHMGIPIIDPSPLGVARKTSEFLANLIIEAEGLK